MAQATAPPRCHYEVLGVPRDADDSTIKKAHRKLALKFHPDKNPDGASSTFVAIQQAYECLSDTNERRWYDEHRDAILKGWKNGETADDIVVDVMPFIYPGCYSGFGDDANGFYAVYSGVFEQAYDREASGSDDSVDYLSQSFGNSKSSWESVAAFYQAWESFASTLNFAWADPWDLTDAEHRSIRRAMEDENKKARRSARKEYNESIVALVRFVKRRDPRVKRRMQEVEGEKEKRQEKLKHEAKLRKKEKKEQLELWRQESELETAIQEEEDRIAGRVRLADLEDDYEYGRGKGKKGKKNKQRSRTVDDQPQDNDEKQAAEGDAVEQDLNGDAVVADDMENGVEESELGSASHEEEEQVCETEEEEEEPDEWRCECCKKDFKSQGQMDNHVKSKKHKAAWKKCEAAVAALEDGLVEDLLDELAVSD